MYGANALSSDCFLSGVFPRRSLHGRKAFLECGFLNVKLTQVHSRRIPGRERIPGVEVGTEARLRGLRSLFHERLGA